MNNCQGSHLKWPKWTVFKNFHATKNWFHVCSLLGVCSVITKMFEHQNSGINQKKIIKFFKILTKVIEGFDLGQKNQNYHRHLCTFNFADLTHANLNSYSLKPSLKLKLPFVSDSRWKSGGPSRSSLGLLLDPSNCSCQVNNVGESRLCLTGFFGVINRY